MLADDLALIDLDGRHIRGWLDVLLPPALLETPSWVLLVCEGRQLHHAVISGRGAVRPSSIDFVGTGRRELAATRKSLGVSAALAVTPATFAEMAADAERRIALGDHYTAQSLAWVAALRAQNRRGIWLDPPLLDLIPPLRSDALETTFDLLVPDDTSLACYVITDDRTRLVASVIAVKRAGRIAEVTSHRSLAPAVVGARGIDERALARDWTSSYRQVLDLIAERHSTPSVALFIERASLRRILAGPPDQLSRELKQQRAIIDPMPRWLAGLLGGAAAVAAAQRGARKLSSLLPERARRAAQGIADSASRRAKESGAHPWQVLGFDPVELFRSVQKYYAE